MPIRVVEKTFVGRHELEDLPGSALPEPTERVWHALIPRVHAALAAPDGVVEFPSWRAVQGNHRAECAYWSAAVYCMTYLLGWTSPGAGLKWWLLDQDRTRQDSSVLQILAEVWDDQRQLDLLASWYWRFGHIDQARLREQPGVLEHNWSKTKVGGIKPAWWENISVRAATNMLLPDEVSSDNLHLGHVSGAATGSGTSELIVSSNSQRRAVLLCGQAAGWYQALCRDGALLPYLGERSWHVDVIVRPLGWVGRFRRSRETGLWFTGKHSLHLVGQ